MSKLTQHKPQRQPNYKCQKVNRQQSTVNCQLSASNEQRVPVASVRFTTM